MTREQKIDAAMRRIHEAAKALAAEDPTKIRGVEAVMAYERAMEEMRRAFDALDRAEQMEKLVRDWIPRILQEKGVDAKFRRVTSEAEYVELLEAKLREEVGEWFASRSAEELADIIEVAVALSVATGTNELALHALRSTKAAERGFFFQGHVLIAEVEDS